MIHFYNKWHLGDCLRQIHFQRHLPVHSTLWCHRNYHEELAPFVRFSLVKLGDITQKPVAAIDSWIGQDMLHEKWGWKEDFAAFFLKFTKFLADKVGFPSPLTTPKHLLWDGPAIWRSLFNVPEVLLINSVPLSGQWDTDLTPLNKLACHIRVPLMTTELIPPSPLGFRIRTTRIEAPRVIDIAGVAAKVKYVIGVDTGPMIPTYNIYSSARHIVLHNSVSYDGYPNTITVKTMAALQRVLEAENLLA